MYNLEQAMEFLGIGVSTELLPVFGSFYGAVGIVLYILMAFGIFEMAKKAKIKNPWLAFIPIVNIYTFGRVAQCYVKNSGKKSAKFGAWLLALKILKLVFAAVFTVMLIIAVISVSTSLYDAYNNAESVTAEMFASLIPVIAMYFILLATAIAYKIVYYVALWRIFAVFNFSNATLFTVLSVFFGFLPEIFVFAIRNKEPQITEVNDGALFETSEF